MSWIQAIGRRSTPLDALPFEELVRSHGAQPQQTYAEFTRRLRVVVSQAALMSVRRSGNAPTQGELDVATRQVFEDFTPGFASGSPDSVLLRFAQSIRRRLGDESFRLVAYRFYSHLPLYQVRNDAHRKVLSIVFEVGLGPDLEGTVATRGCMSPDRARTLLKEATAALGRVVSDDYVEHELRQNTEGYLP